MEANTITQTITIPSRRYYLDEIEIYDPNKILVPYSIKGYGDILALNFERFGIMVEWTYNLLYNEYIEKMKSKQSDQKTQKSKGEDEPTAFKSRQVADEYYKRYKAQIAYYHITSIYARANGILSSQKELQKQYNSDFQKIQDNRNEKVNSLIVELNSKLEIKNLLIQRSKAKKNHLVFDDTVFEKYRLKLSKETIRFYGYRNTVQELSVYLYECKLDKDIKRLKSNIALIREKIKRAELKHTGLPKRVTFGSKKHYRSKDTKHMDKEQLCQWHRERDARRFNNILFCGRHVSPDGNYVCKYDPNTKVANVSLPDGHILKLKDVQFPYRGEELRKLRLDPLHPAVGYTLQRYQDSKGRTYLILKASIKITQHYVNYCTRSGVVSIDINYDHIALTELDDIGCLINKKVYPFKLEGLCSGAATVILGNIAKQIICYCTIVGKPLIREDLKLDKTDIEYKSKASKRKISAMAYSKFIALLEGQAFQQQVGIIPVNPAYTSCLGKVKYMKQLGTSIHIAAAYVIGRRGMKLRSRIPTRSSLLL
ncbi:MAG: IS200/IS605 family accessory protein TnpB-related protein [Clostridiales bacterium]|nr:IS200/IS605 family accessory protein TnpB-related protein [Clostridiales bacterium]